MATVQSVIPADLVDQIDAIRGPQTRSAWIKEAIEQKLHATCIRDLPCPGSCAMCASVEDQLSAIPKIREAWKRHFGDS